MQKSQGAIATSFVSHFESLTDPRVVGRTTIPFINVLFIGVTAVICGVDSYTGMVTFARAKRDWLSRYLDLSTGIPAHDTFNDIFGKLNPQEFEDCLLSWIKSLCEITAGQVLAIDGKTLRRSYDNKENKAAIHMVSVWATANHISLGSVAVADKSNEITAIPKLLELIDVAGGIVTIDAMGCQKKIVQTIIDQGADYIIAVKGNQPQLEADIVDYVSEHLENEFADIECSRYETTEKGHGRRERRTYYQMDVPATLRNRENWQGLKTVGVAFRVSEENGEQTEEVRFYISSLKRDAKRFGRGVRTHWGIESLHWQLDVTFLEDASRVRKDHGAANMNILRRFAISLLKQETTEKVGIAIKRQRAGWDETYLEKVLACL